MSETFCQFCGTSTNPIFSPHREETCSKNPANRKDEPKPEPVAAQVEAEVPQAEETATSSTTQAPTESAAEPEVFHLPNWRALHNHLAEYFEADGDPAISGEDAKRFEEAFRSRVKTRGKYVLEEFIERYGLSTAAAKPIILRVVDELASEESTAAEDDAGKKPQASKSIDLKSMIAQAQKPVVSRELLICRGSEITLRRVTWLWKPLIPLKELSVFAGMPDTGKGTTAADTMARITTRRAFPEQGAFNLDRDEILILSGEESYDTTTLPRIAAAGGDLGRVHLVTGVKITGAQSQGERTLALLTDVDLLDKHLAQNPRIVLVVIDPVDCYFAGAKKNAPEDVTLIYGALKTLADKFSIAILLIDHLNKDTEKAALHRISGAGAAGARPRSAWLFAKDKENPKLRHIANLKGNLLTEEEKQGWKFEIKGKMLRIEDTDQSIGTVHWLGRDCTTADELLAKRDPELTAIGRATKWLEQTLAKGKRLATELYSEAEEEGISKRTLCRAKDRLKVISFRQPKGKGPWYWELTSKDKKDGQGNLKLEPQAEETEEAF